MEVLFIDCTTTSYNQDDISPQMEHFIRAISEGKGRGRYKPLHKNSKLFIAFYLIYLPRIKKRSSYRAGTCPSSTSASRTSFPRYSPTSATACALRRRLNHHHLPRTPTHRTGGCQFLPRTKTVPADFGLGPLRPDHASVVAGVFSELIVAEALADGAGVVEVAAGGMAIGTFDWLVPHGFSHHSLGLAQTHRDNSLLSYYFKRIRIDNLNCTFYPTCCRRTETAGERRVAFKQPVQAFLWCLASNLVNFSVLSGNVKHSCWKWPGAGPQFNVLQYKQEQSGSMLGAMFEHLGNLPQFSVPNLLQTIDLVLQRRLLPFLLAGLALAAGMNVLLCLQVVLGPEQVSEFREQEGVVVALIDDLLGGLVPQLKVYNVAGGGRPLRQCGQVGVVGVFGLSARALEHFF